MVGCRGCCADAVSASRDVPGRCSPATISDADAMRIFGAWQAAGGPALEESVRRTRADHRVSRCATGSRCPALPPRDRHRLAPDVVLGADPRASIHPVSPASRRRPARTTRPPMRSDVAADRTPPTARRNRPSRRWPNCPQARRSGHWCTRSWRTPTRSPPIWPPNSTEHVVKQQLWWPMAVAPETLAAALVPMHDTVAGSARRRPDLAAISECRTGCVSWTSKSPWPEAISGTRRSPIFGSRIWGRCFASTSPPEIRCCRTPTG